MKSLVSMTTAESPSDSTIRVRAESKAVKIGCKTEEVATSAEPFSLLSLCVGLLGEHLEELIDDSHLFMPDLPSSVRLSIGGIAQRRGLLCDALLSTLVDASWRVLSVADCPVSDKGMNAVAARCSMLEVIDITCCDCITSAGLANVLSANTRVHTLRCGGTSASDRSVRRALPHLVPTLRGDADGGSWEEVDVGSLGRGALALRWMVWPSVDEKSAEYLAKEWPKLQLNPQRSTRRHPVPIEALPNTHVDAPFVLSINPKVWRQRVEWREEREDSDTKMRRMALGLPIAERFRLAYVWQQEVSKRMSPLQIKNARKNKRRYERAKHAQSSDGAEIYADSHSHV